jgi:hypothetical protein
MEAWTVEDVARAIELLEQIQYALQVILWAFAFVLGWSVMGLWMRGFRTLGANR